MGQRLDGCGGWGLGGARPAQTPSPTNRLCVRSGGFMELFDLRGKVALVTGGNGGIGLGIARGLAQAGADVAIAGRNEAKHAAALDDLKGLGVRAAGIIAD